MNYPSILSAKESALFEEIYFLNNDNSELEIIRQVGKEIAKDFLEEAYAPKKIKSVLLLLGKGHNASDGLAFLQAIAKKLKYAKIYVLTCFNINDLRDNTSLLLEELCRSGLSVEYTKVSKLNRLEKVDLVVEAIAGMRTRASLSEEFKEILKKVNAFDSIKVSIDMPFGISDDEVELAFEADYTYATAIAKSELFLDCNAKYVGRIRYIDIGFFDGQVQDIYAIYAPENLKFFNKLRRVFSDKRDYGFLLVLAGSMEYKGAALLNVQAALRSSVGLVRAFVPEALEVSYASKEPSAMYTGASTCQDGFLSLENLFLVKKYLAKASAILIGSGLGQSAETQVLVAEIIKLANCPIILDADAITLKNLELLKGKNAIITPHNGEFLRLAKDCSDTELMRVAKEYGVTVLLKGRFVRVCDGERIVINTMASPALARGSTGDILAGITGALVANKELNLSLLDAGLSAYAMLAKASHKAVYEYGENAFSASELIKYLNRK